MKTKEIQKYVLNDESLEQVAGGVDDGLNNNAGKILDDYAGKDTRVKAAGSSYSEAERQLIPENTETVLK